ncbi:unnamed protein product [Musa acuminata subsp. burmannicoides]
MKPVEFSLASAVSLSLSYEGFGQPWRRLRRMLAETTTRSTSSPSSWNTRSSLASRARPSSLLLLPISRALRSGGRRRGPGFIGPNRLFLFLLLGGLPVSRSF